ncbi:MAG: hypothetical protein AAF153_03325, partial [Pseudomonadota bacterium]
MTIIRDGAHLNNCFFARSAQACAILLSSMTSLGLVSSLVSSEQNLLNYSLLAISLNLSWKFTTNAVMSTDYTLAATAVILGGSAGIGMLSIMYAYKSHYNDLIAANGHSPYGSSISNHPACSATNEDFPGHINCAFSIGTAVMYEFFKWLK